VIKEIIYFGKKKREMQYLGIGGLLEEAYV